ncbi:MAG: colanic acid biosynthesis glycosyltransferase WcaL, partial [Pseudomonadota bacterium]
MRVAYLASQYPAVSHTFILREVQAVRALGVEVETFSIRRCQPVPALGPDGTDECARTRYLVPVRPLSYLAALVWALFTRPGRLIRTGVRGVPWNLARG